VEGDFKLILKEWQAEVNTRLMNELDGRRPALLYQPIRYVFEGGGKRIRPVLALLSSKVISGAVDQCWDAAVAIEILHNFTLVHDDIMDRDDTRRGRPTLHKQYGDSISLLAGDGLVALAYQVLLRTRSSQLDEIARRFTDGIVVLCEGQAMDLEFESRTDVTLDEYLEMISKKTAKLLDVSASIGALVGDAEPAEADALGRFAYNLGCAFQIQDDLLDILSDESTTGKTYGSDIKRNKKTYLSIHALNEGTQKDRKRLSSLLGGADIGRDEIDEVKGIFQRVGSIDEAQRAVQHYVESAHRCLDKLRFDRDKVFLLGFLDYISNRNA
jgi:geranylgeranyl diphosphate synthase type II